MAPQPRAPPPMPHDSHDALVKAIFGRPDYAADELRAVLPSALVARLDLRTLSVCPGSFVSEELSKRHADLLYRVDLDQREAFIYILFEHQSSTDVLMPYRLMRYVVSIWDTYLAEHPGATTLPVVVPVVLHHSDAGWRAPTSLSELYKLDDDTLAAIGEYLPRLRFILDDLSTQDDADLRRRDMAAAAKLALLALRGARLGAELIHSLRAWMDLMEQASAAPDDDSALTTVLHYILQHSGFNHAAFKQIINDIRDSAAKETIMTTAEMLREEGSQQTARRMLTKLLRLRFGDLPNAVIHNIENAPLDLIERWVERVITQDSLEDIFA